MKKALKVALELGHRYTGNLLKGIDSKTVKGQLISKCLFGVFNFFQKTPRFHSSRVEFICLFFGRNVGLKKSFWLCLTFRI